MNKPQRHIYNMNGLHDVLMTSDYLLTVAPAFNLTCRRLLPGWNAVYRWRALERRAQTTPPWRDELKSAFGSLLIYKQLIPHLRGSVPLYQVDILSTSDSTPRSDHVHYQKYDPYNEVVMAISSTSGDIRTYGNIWDLSQDIFHKVCTRAAMADMLDGYTISVTIGQREPQTFCRLSRDVEDMMSGGDSCVIYSADSPHYKYIAANLRAIMGYFFSQTLNVLDFLPDLLVRLD
jgi:hypothetical protein